MADNFKPRFYSSGRPWAEAILHLSLALLFFIAILLNRSPNLLRPISMTLRTGFALTIAVTVLILYVAFRLPGWLGRVLALTLTLGLFAFPLAGLWASGQTQPTVISGLIPLYDANEYYIDALRLLAGQDFSVFSARRPLFPGLFAVVLGLTGRNLMTALAVFTALTGLACYLAAREIQRTHGAEAAVFVLTIMFLFYRAHSGVAMSENLGVPLGTLGFALLWRGAAERSRWLVLTGIFTTTLALNARAGAFFVLPLLILWAGWYFRPDGKLLSCRVLISGIAVVFAGFAIDLILVRLLATPAGVPFANFSYTLFGLASGGNHWHYVVEAHPEVLALQEPEQSRRIYQLAFELIRQRPELLVQGIFLNWRALFSDSWYNLYAYVGGENRAANLVARWALYLFSLLGFYRWLRNRSDPFNSLVLMAALGVFLSVPFVPPTDGYRMRPYAASIIIFALVPAMGLVFVLERLAGQYLVKPANLLGAKEWTAALTIPLIAAMLAGPLIVKGIGSPPEPSTVSCKTGLDSLLIHYDPGTFVNIFRQNQPFLDWMPDFHYSLFRLNAHSLGDPEFVAWLEHIRLPHSLFSTLDYRTYRKALVSAPADLLPEPGSTLVLCGQWETDSRLASYDIFYVEEARPLSR